MKVLVSIDVGQNGKLLHKNYDNMLLSHEKAQLNLVDNMNFISEKATLEFKK